MFILMMSPPDTARKVTGERSTLVGPEPRDEKDRPTREAAPASHEERVRASLAWALNEYARTLEKLSK